MPAQTTDVVVVGMGNAAQAAAAAAHDAGAKVLVLEKAPARCFGNLAGTNDLKEGTSAFLEKKKPNFID